jgi:hypothetical protein
VLSDVLLLLPVEVLCLTTLGFKVSQRQRGCVLDFKRYEGRVNSGGKGEVMVLTFSVLLEKRELTVKPPLLKP